MARLRQATKRDFWRWAITLLIILLPFLLWAFFIFTANDLGDEWNQSIKRFADQVARGSGELRSEVDLLPEEDRAWGQSVVELLENTNPALLLAMIVALGSLFTIIFLLSWIIALLYLFFAYYFVRKPA